jgi:hypothetical protein
MPRPSGEHSKFSDGSPHSGGLHHRSVKIPDLLIAAAAEAAQATVLHYDEDYDRIAAITGQPVQWIAPRGSL